MILTGESQLLQHTHHIEIFLYRLDLVFAEFNNTTRSHLHGLAHCLNHGIRDLHRSRMRPTHYGFITHNIGFTRLLVCLGMLQYTSAKLQYLRRLLLSTVHSDVFPYKIAGSAGSDPSPFSIVKGEHWGLSEVVELQICPRRKM